MGRVAIDLFRAPDVLELISILLATHPANVPGAFVDIPAKPHEDDLHTAATAPVWMEKDGRREVVGYLLLHANSTHQAAPNHLEA